MSKTTSLSEDRLELEREILSNVRDVPDFPSKGILFKDINPLFQNPQLSEKIVSHLADYYTDLCPDVIVGVESRGFFYGFPLAMKLGIPFVPIRKKGKLPGETFQVSYNLEYGSATIEVQKDAITPGANVIIHDDVLATGGTALATAQLVKDSGGVVSGYNFIISLDFLNGMEKLRSASENIYNLVRV